MCIRDRRIRRPARTGLQAGGHALDRGRVGRQCCRFAEALGPMGGVVIALDSDQRFDPGLRARHDVVRAEIAGVGDDLLGLVQASRQRLQPLQHRRDLLLVVDRLGDLGDQHQQGLVIDAGLGVVARLEAATPATGMIRDASSVRLS